MSAPWPYRYRAKLTHLADADTLRLAVDMGCKVAIELIVRLRGCNAAEKGTAMGEAGTEFARKWLEQYADDDDWLAVTTHRDPGDRYGRWLADVQSIDGVRDLASDLIAQGLAAPWDGKGRSRTRSRRPRPPARRRLRSVGRHVQRVARRGPASSRVGRPRRLALALLVAAGLLLWGAAFASAASRSWT
jgi:endonuclease YncB( thermonuclease family)